MNNLEFVRQAIGDEKIDTTSQQIWTINETIFNIDTKLFLVINLKTKIIVGYIIYKKPLNEDILIELYDQIFKHYKNNNPIIIHSDNEPVFSSNNLVEFLASKKIKISFTRSNKNQNQVSESINERIKTLVTINLIIKDTKALRYWHKTVPNKFKNP